jgi:outer membrane protein assembly factor BamB
MKLFALPLTLLAFFAGIATLQAQPTGWHNGGGNPERNGYMNVAGPTTDSVLWEVSASGAFGSPLFIEGNYVVTMRFVSSTYAPVECYSLANGSLLWSVDVTNLTGRSHTVGLRDGRVFVVGYTDTFQDSLYALDVTNGSKLWTFNKTVAPYLSETAVFDAAGNLYIYGNFKTYKINPANGQMIWQTPTVPMASGSGEMAVNPTNNTGYTLEQSGGISFLWAIDLATGAKKYSHKVADLQPGGNVPQSGLMVGFSGVVYVQLTEDNVAAFFDNGDKFTPQFQRPITGNSAFSLMCNGADGTIYAPSNGKIIRINPLTGSVLNTSPTISQGGFFSPRLSASNNNMIYATNGENFVYAFDLNLNLLWSDFLPNNNTSGFCLAPNGVGIVSGTNKIRAYTPVNTVSTNEPEAWALALYPNPTTDFAVLSGNDALDGKTCTLTDLAGRIIKTDRLQAGANPLDLTALPPGLYLMKISGMNSALKLVKQ